MVHEDYQIDMSSKSLEEVFNPKKYSADVEGQISIKKG